MRLSTRSRIARVLSLFAVVVFIGCGAGRDATSQQDARFNYDVAKKLALDTIKAGRFDGGRMWTFDYPPLDWFKEAYGFTPDQAWLDDVRMSAIRFANYCSASFVSEDGLVMTNHHCARESVDNINQPGENLNETGFYATGLDDERKVPGLYVDQLVQIRDVTAEVLAAMDKAETDADKLTARDNAIKEIEEKAGAESKLQADVVTFYNGGKYSLYLYKRYTDVRAVFVPEMKLGFFGGDEDNFTYPRYTYDCSFFRVYDENGTPLKTRHYYKWSKAGAKEGEPVFVVGNPGSTNRLNTTEQLEFNRDVQYPYIAGLLNARVEVLNAYAEKHPEKRDAMITEVFSMANSQKAYNGQLAGLRDDRLMQRRRVFDREFKAAVMARPDLAAKYGHVWGEIAQSSAKMREIAPDLLALRSIPILASEYLSKASALARYAYEMAKPEADRPKSYQGRTADLTRRALGKFSQPDLVMEELVLTRQLAMMKRWLGEDDPIIKTALRGERCDVAARRLMAQTVLKDSVVLAQLVDGLPGSLEQSNDVFIAMARMMVPRADAAQKSARESQARDQVNEGLLGRALFDVYGTAIPPDATFSLRIADGVVKGFEYNGTKAPSHTTFYGMYDRNASFEGQNSWSLPEKWLNPPKEFNLATPLNFVSTNDIIGGNSGSPMINRNKEVVGLIFDGNIESLPGDFIFAEDANNRTVSVHSSAMVEALRHIYKAQRIADELVNGKRVQ